MDIGKILLELTPNVWQKISLYFSCPNSVDLYADDARVGTGTWYCSGVDQVKWISTGMGTVSCLSIVYLDALGYSWSPAYQVGDNQLPTHTDTPDTYFICNPSKVAARVLS